MQILSGSMIGEHPLDAGGGQRRSIDAAVASSAARVDGSN
jgi:hypothetical protein